LTARVVLVAFVVAASTALTAAWTAEAEAPDGAGAEVPILMYHELEAPPPRAPYPELYVRPKAFGEEARWLTAHRYHAVTLDQAYARWRRGASLPPRPVVLSFDDGYPGDVSVALPVLRRFGWIGVLNLQIGNLGPTRVRKLISAGWEVDAHTFTHPDLTTVDAARLAHEVAGSRRWIQRVFHVPVDFFCYPSGRYDAAVVAAVRRAGYLGATTTRFGLASPADGMFTLDRVRIDGSDGVAGLAAKLRGLGLPA
jgi:peptidoglycan/xylan/chitin deacetylase (PgdA/CDA1 family)